MPDPLFDLGGFINDCYLVLTGHANVTYPLSGHGAPSPFVRVDVSFPIVRARLWDRDVWQNVGGPTITSLVDPNNQYNPPSYGTVSAAIQAAYLQWTSGS